MVAKPARTSAKHSGTHAPVIDRSLRVADLLALLPDASGLLQRYGLFCDGCALGAFETLEEGCRLHGFSDGDVDDLLQDLREFAARRPARSQTLTVTQRAAEALRAVLEREGKIGQGLKVTLEEGGGFCLEFIATPARDDRVFGHAAIPQVNVFASLETLARIGGATIDWREERFKLDLPEDNEQCVDCEHETCVCGKHASLNTQTAPRL